MRRFYIPSEKIRDDTVVMTGREAHHLISVLRCKQGDDVVVFDGTGGQWQAVIMDIDSRQATLRIIAPVDKDTESGLDLAVAQGYLKDKKMDALVRPLTELGVSRWLPFQSSRTVPAPNLKRMESRFGRWRKIAIESLKQCRRARPLAIDDVRAFEDLLEQAVSYDLKVMFWEQADTAFLPDHMHEIPQSIFLLFGPEGGFELSEVRAAQANGFRICSLGPRILRAETATVAACAIFQNLYGDIGIKFA